MAEEIKNNSTEDEIEENEDVEDQDNSKDDSGNSDKNSDSDKDNKSGKDKSGDDKGRSDKIFTQVQVNRMMTREKNQGRNAAYKELGIDPKDSKTIAMVKEWIDSQKTDEQKAAENNAEVQNKMNEAEQRAQVAEAKAEAMMLGVKTQYVDDVVTLALAKMTEDSDLKTIIGEFKTKYHAWFSESSDEDDNNKNNDKGKTGQRGTGSSIKNSDKEKKNEEKGLGARLAAQRKSSGKKSSYWGNNR